MYKIIEQIIPMKQRKQINEKILYLIENNKCEEMQITKEDIFNSYTGEGGYMVFPFLPSKIITFILKLKRR